MSNPSDTRGTSLRSLFSFLLKRRQDVRGLKAMLNLPDSVLNDIGVSRWDVANALHSDWNQLPSRTLSLTVSKTRSLYEAANDTRETLSKNFKTPGDVQEVRMAA